MLKLDISFALKDGLLPPLLSGDRDGPFGDDMEKKQSEDGLISGDVCVGGGGSFE